MTTESSPRSVRSAKLRLSCVSFVSGLIASGYSLYISRSSESILARKPLWRERYSCLGLVERELTILKNRSNEIAAKPMLTGGYEWYVYRAGATANEALWRWTGVELVPELLRDTAPWQQVVERLRAVRSLEKVMTPRGQAYVELRRQGRWPLLCCACPSQTPVECTPEALRLVFAALRMAVRGTGELAAARTSLRELQQKRDLALQKERGRALTDLASSIAHDYNNLLSTICLRSEMGQLLSTDKILSEHFQAIHSSALQGASVTRRIQEYAGARQGEAPELLDFGEVIRDIVATDWPGWLDKTLAAEVTCHLHCHLADDLHVLAEEEGLRELLGNILTNAVEAMPGGGEITLTLQRAGNEVRLSCHDTGPGMPPEVLEKVLSPFFTTKGPDHVGLGLSVAHSIVSRCQGNLQVASQTGQGTQVEVHLPLADLSQLREKRTPTPAATSQQAAPCYRVLLVDDEPEVCEVLGLALREMGHEVIEAGEGREALHCLRHRGLFDALILDLGMPGMNGWEVASVARQLQPQAAIALLTGWGDKIAQGNDGRIDRILNKPVSMQNLNNTLKSMVTEKQAAAAAQAPVPVALISGLNC
jgi:signal transduction histidine kinase/ActR/RegA family two-component response regulator